MGGPSGDLVGGSSRGPRGWAFRGGGLGVGLQGDLVGGSLGGPCGWVFRRTSWVGLQVSLVVGLRRDLEGLVGGPSGESWWVGLQRDLVGGPSWRPCGRGLQVVIMNGSSGDLKSWTFRGTSWVGRQGGPRG